MNYVNFYGLFAAAFVVASLAAIPFKSIKNRLIAVVILWGVLIIPFNADGRSLAFTLFALFDTVSLSLLFYLGCKICNIRESFQISELLFLAVFSLTIYFSELGYIPFDLYCWGFNRQVSVCLACLAILLFRFNRIWLILLGLLFFQIDLYSNWFDVIFDPIIAVVVWIHLLSFAIVRFRRKKEENITLTEEKI